MQIHPCTTSKSAFPGHPSFVIEKSFDNPVGYIISHPVCQKCKGIFTKKEEENYVCECGATVPDTYTFYWRKSGICIVRC